MSLARSGRAIAVLMLVLASLTAMAAAGHADPSDPNCYAPDPNNPDVLVYICGEDGEPETPGGPGGGGGNEEPPCDLSNPPYTQFCDGEAACWGNDPAANPPSEELAEEPRPSPEHHMAYKSCQRPDGSTYDDWYWSDGPDEPTPGERALAALGVLQLPAFEAKFNPPGRTLVNLDTWWWADGAVPEEVRGTAALGVVAVAYDGHMEIDPGDGSATLTCPVSTSPSDTCAYVYRRSSDGYTATMRLVYSIKFELAGGGAFPTPAGVPTTFRGAPRTVEVPVREVQTVVQPAD